MLNKLPRDFKFTLGDRLQNQLLDLMELYITAYYSPTKEKNDLLKKANIKLTIARHLFRLAFELGLYSSKRYEHYARKLHEIGKMTGGWLKTIK